MAQLEAVAPTDDNEDTSLPDPERKASAWSAVFAAVAVAIAIAVEPGRTSHPTVRPLEPANLAIFAGLYIGARVVERIAEYVAPFLPWWLVTAPATTGATSSASKPPTRRC